MVPVRFHGFKTIVAPTARVGAFAVTPVARSVSLTWGRGGVVWAWPCAVDVSSDDASGVSVSGEGRTSRLRIVNATRWAQAAILLAAGLCAWRLLNLSSTRKEGSP